MEKNLWRTGCAVDIAHQEWNLGIIIENLGEKNLRNSMKKSTWCWLESEDVYDKYLGRE